MHQQCLSELSSNLLPRFQRRRREEMAVDVDPMVYQHVRHPVFGREAPPTPE